MRSQDGMLFGLHGSRARKASGSSAAAGRAALPAWAYNLYLTKYLHGESAEAG